MAIFRGSRYEDSVVDFVTTVIDGDALPIVFYEFSNFGVSGYIEYTVVEGDRLDQLATKFYKSPMLWWLIPEFNPTVQDTLDLIPGLKLKILLND
jgi:nucleoid-associated protein YgaU